VTALEFKKLAGLVLRTKGVPISVATCCPKFRYKDAFVIIVGLLNLKRLEVYVIHPRVLAITNIQPVFRSKAETILHFAINKRIIDHLTTIALLDLMAEA
jgi:hypothetical protein